jgi:MazG family protein
VSSSPRAASALEAVARLDEVTRRLRRECPWDREQNERTIVPHTVEEAYELADAAYRGDDGRLLDELGDVLFQVEFLALLLEERGAGDLAAVADHCVQKLIRRHPHVFGSLEVSSADEVLRNWDQIKRDEQGREPGLFGDVPETLPGLLYARKLLRRAGVSAAEGSAEAVREKVAGLEGVDTAAAQFERLGDVLFELVALARKLRVDPELALRAAADRFRERALEAEAASGVSGEERA